MAALVCGSCGIVVYREGELLKAGKEAILAPPMSDVEVGATGRVLGRKMRVVRSLSRETVMMATPPLILEQQRYVTV